MLEIVAVHHENKKLIKQFLDNGGTSLHSFRYFNSRPLSIIENHLATYVIVYNQKVIGYGHLDQEKEIVWLGIAIAEDYRGVGLGKLMMQQLTTTGRLLEVNEIQLSVDLDNEQAIPLYKKFGFTEWKRNDKVVFFKKVL